MRYVRRLPDMCRVDRLCKSIKETARNGGSPETTGVKYRRRSLSVTAIALIVTVYYMFTCTIV